MGPGLQHLSPRRHLPGHRGAPRRAPGEQQPGEAVRRRAAAAGGVCVGAGAGDPGRGGEGEGEAVRGHLFWIMVGYRAGIEALRRRYASFSVTDCGNGEREATQSDTKIYSAERQMPNTCTPPLDVFSNHACRSVGISTKCEGPDMPCLVPRLNRYDEAKGRPSEAVSMANDPDMVPSIHAPGVHLSSRDRPLITSNPLA